MTIIKKATFVIDGKDDTKKATDSAKRNVKAAAGEMGKSMQSAALVTDRAGKKLSAFNEKTEKMRQILSATGTEMGQAAGTAVFYGGTISAMVGRFNAMEIAIFAAGIAITALTWLIMQQDDEVKTWKERLVLTAGTVGDLEESLVDMRFELEKSINKWDQYDIALGKARIEFIQLKLQADALEAKMKETKVLAGSRFGLQSRTEKAREHQQELSDLREALSATEAVIRGVQKLKDDAANEDKRRDEERERQRRAKGITRGAGREAERLKKEQQQLLGAARDAILQREAQEAKERLSLVEHDRKKKEQRERALTAEAARLLRHHDHLADLEATASKKRLDAEKKEAEALKKIQQDQLAVREQSIQNQLALAEQSIGIAAQIGDMFDLWGVSAAKSEKEREKAEAKRIATISALNMALEIARAAAAYPNIPEMAAHALAATLFAASLGKAISSLAGGGAGAGAGGATARVRTPERTTREEAEEGARQAVVINVFGHQFFDTRDADRAMFEGSRNFEMSQRPGRDQGRF